GVLHLEAEQDLQPALALAHGQAMVGGETGSQLPCAVARGDELSGSLHVISPFGGSGTGGVTSCASAWPRPWSSRRPLPWLRTWFRTWFRTWSLPWLRTWPPPSRRAWLR